MIILRTSWGKVAAGVLTLALGSSLAAMPQGQGVILTKTLSLDLAEAVAQGALDACRKTGQHASFAVLDANGDMKVFFRDDNSGPHTIPVARIKAYTALILRRPSMDIAKAQADKPDPRITVMLNAAGGVPIEGGVPIKVGDQTIGSIGTSGARGDTICSAAGVDAVADKLKP